MELNRAGDGGRALEARLDLVPLAKHLQGYTVAGECNHRFMYTIIQVSMIQGFHQS